MATQIAIATRNDFGLMVEQADTLVKSGFLPKGVNTPQKATAIMMMGRELGITPWMAFNGINVIMGKPTISPQLMLALIHRSGEAEEIKIDGDDQQCTVTMKRKGHPAHTEKFSMKDANRIMTRENNETIPLAQKYNWRQMPATMLKWRAVAACARVVFPDVIMGFYTPEEIESGDVVVIEEPPKEPESKKKKASPKKVKTAKSKPAAKKTTAKKASKSGPKTRSAAQVKVFLVELTGKYRENNARLANRKNLEQVLASRFDAALDKDKNKRQRSMHHLSEVTSFTELELPELLAYRDWLGTDGGFGNVAQEVATEARAVYDDAIGEVAV